jgi:DNA helicase-2/ATP-dependent DNA helicase PcrA
LIVTFTVAARQELISRLNEDKRFASIRDNVEVTTLNSWGYRRIRTVASYPKLVTDKKDYHFAMLNQLQPIWRKHDRVKGAIEKKSGTTPRKLMNLLDAFKSVGFDHLRCTNYEQFSERFKELYSQGLGPKIDEHLDELVKLGVLPSKIDRKGEEQAKIGEREVYNSFFRFWRDATEHLIESATFTLEDQKYVAYLDERQKLEEGKRLSGAARYDHILVDEFQDINPLDLALVKAIVERNRATITICGDDDQALFEWRGATPEYILDPSRFFGKKFSTFTLSRNYRSPKNIVEHAQKLIANNTRRVEKEITADRKEIAEIDVRATTDLDEAMELVYAESQSSIGRGESPSRVAIIGRKRSQIIPYQVFFASNNISFCAAEDLQVFMGGAFDRLLKLIMIKSECDRRQMRTQVVDNILELCNVAKRYSLSKSDREALRRHLNESNASTVSAAVEALAEYRGSLKGQNKDGKMSMEIADAIRRFLRAETVSDSLVEMGESFQGLQVDLGKAEDDIFYADPPFLYLAEYAVRYGNDYMQFIEDIERAKDQLAYVPPFEESSVSSTDELWKRPIHLMTAIRAKGKEFDTVILLDVNDEIWPNRNARTPAQREAERRVFYVAFTRAKKRILMFVNDKYRSRMATPSPYIDELGLPE